MTVHSKLTDASVILKIVLVIGLGIPALHFAGMLLGPVFSYHPTLLKSILIFIVAVTAYIILADFIVSIFKAFIQPASLVFLTLGGGAIWFVGHFLF